MLNLKQKVCVEFGQVHPTLWEMNELVSFLNNINWPMVSDHDILYFSSNSSTAKYDFRVHYAPDGSSIHLKIVSHRVRY